MNYKITPSNIPNEGILFVDHQKNNRSGHLSHALVEYKQGCVISFYSNCSSQRNNGHNGFGWIEYKRSCDNGITWGDATILPYSWESFINHPYTISCETAVSAKENEIVAFCTRCTNPNGWEPYIEPTVIISTDAGESWSEPTVLCDKCGRVYDSIVVDGVIYVLIHAAPDWLATNADHKYYIYKSSDHGKTFALHGTLPGDPTNRAYGNMVLREDGALICYAYNKSDEYNLDYFISTDMGKTWIDSGKSFCKKRIRNPQVARFNGGYILHGRSGCESDELPCYFVLYKSADGLHWDDGVYLCEAESKAAYYSNNLALNDGNHILIQSSVAYDGGRVNIAHWYIDCE